VTRINIPENRTGNSSKTAKGKNNGHIVFFICLLIASFFWLLIKLSDQYQEVFVFKINYNNAPTEKLLTSIVDTNLSITIKAKGFEMLKIEMTEDLSLLDIDLRNYEIINSEGNLYYVNTNELKDKISQVINIPQNQIEISGHKLEFKMDDLLEKNVSIVNRVNFNFAPQFKLYSSVLISPVEVKIFGPKNILDTIQNIYTVEKNIMNISSFIDENVELANPNSNLLHLSINDVSIKASVEKFTESSIEMPIDLSNIIHQVKAFPNTVTVFFTVAQKDFSNIRPSQFKVRPNLNGIDIMKANKLQLKVVEKPEFISGIRMQPSEIEFLIIK
jgi:hypothetical protein